MDLGVALRSRTVVLDGGLATELEARGHDLSGALWSARLIRDDPTAIQDVHRAYFDAGAEVATTASYQATEPWMLRRSVELARAARDAHGSGWVAASVGPYGAVLADGSEYRGDYGLSVGELREFHRPRLAALAAAGPDVLAVETIPSLAEIEAVLAELPMPAWLSVTCSGTSLRTGEPAAAAFEMAAACDSVIALGVNCTAPADAAALVPLAASYGKPVVTYPNSGEEWTGVWTGRPAFDPEDVRGWVRDGARLVGGCCRVGPSDVSAIRACVGTP